MQLPDGHDRGAQINGARAVPPFSAALCLTSVGPPPVISSFLPPFPYCRVSSIHPSSLVRVALPSSHHPLITCHASRSFPHQPLTRRRVRFSRLPPPLGVFRHGSSSVTPLTSRHSFHAPPRRHHSYHTPYPPRWPPCPSLKLFSYSRWQREKSSVSRNAELAGPFSIPRSSY
jgi:hypothetical protein